MPVATIEFKPIRAQISTLAAQIVRFACGIRDIRVISGATNAQTPSGESR
jgi:hypothetical protein